MYVRDASNTHILHTLMGDPSPLFPFATFADDSAQCFFKGRLRYTIKGASTLCKAQASVGLVCVRDTYMCGTVVATFGDVSYVVCPRSSPSDVVGREVQGWFSLVGDVYEGCPKYPLLRCVSVGSPLDMSAPIVIYEVGVSATPVQLRDYDAGKFTPVYRIGYPDPPPVSYDRYWYTSYFHRSLELCVFYCPLGGTPYATLKDYSVNMNGAPGFTRGGECIGMSVSPDKFVYALHIQSAVEELVLRLSASIPGRYVGPGVSPDLIELLRGIAEASNLVLEPVGYNDVTRYLTKEGLSAFGDNIVDLRIKTMNGRRIFMLKSPNVDEKVFETTTDKFAVVHEMESIPLSRFLAEHCPRLYQLSPPDDVHKVDRINVGYQVIVVCEDDPVRLEMTQLRGNTIGFLLTGLGTSPHLSREGQVTNVYHVQADSSGTPRNFYIHPVCTDVSAFDLRRETAEERADAERKGLSTDIPWGLPNMPTFDLIGLLQVPVRILPAAPLVVERPVGSELDADAWLQRKCNPVLGSPDGRYAESCSYGTGSEHGVRRARMGIGPPAPGSPTTSYANVVYDTGRPFYAMFTRMVVLKGNPQKEQLELLVKSVLEFFKGCESRFEVALRQTSGQQSHVPQPQASSVPPPPKVYTSQPPQESPVPPPPKVYSSPPPYQEYPFQPAQPVPAPPPYQEYQLQQTASAPPPYHSYHFQQAQAASAPPPYPPSTLSQSENYFTPSRQPVRALGDESYSTQTTRPVRDYSYKDPFQ